MDSTTPAAVLTAAIESAVIEPTARHRRESPALRAIVRRRREPLDLDADVFRYLVDRDGNVQPVVMVPAPFCDCGRAHR